MQQSPSPQNATIHAFEDAFIGIVNDTRNLSFAYQDEIAKLQSGVYDNQTFVTVTDLYLQMYQQLLARAGTLNQSAASLPQNYSKAIDLYSESIRTEMESQEHLRNYYSTGDLAENEKSNQLLSESLKFELEAFKAFRSVANDTTTSHNNTENISNATAAILGV
jgi:TPR repeat protein